MTSVEFFQISYAQEIWVGGHVGCPWQVPGNTVFVEIEWESAWLDLSVVMNRVLTTPLRSNFGIALNYIVNTLLETSPGAA